MDISELFKTKKTLYSLEIFPPKKDNPIDTVLTTLSGLRELDCDFISVTYGAGGSEVQRDKTVDIAALIKSVYNREPVAHLTCVGSSCEEVDRMLERLARLGVKNILALRGDLAEGVALSPDFTHASDLAAYISRTNPDFHLIGACYPERHYEAPDLASDIENLKKKIDAGVSHLITQLFFDNSAFFGFLERVRAAGIGVPIEAGIMPIMSARQIERTISMCGASIPAPLSKLINKYSAEPEALFDAGTDYALQQIDELVGGGVDGIHLYTMNNVEAARRITEGCRAWL